MSLGLAYSQLLLLGWLGAALAGHHYTFPGSGTDQNWKDWLTITKELKEGDTLTLEGVHYTVRTAYKPGAEGRPFRLVAASGEERILKVPHFIPDLKEGNILRSLRRSNVRGIPKLYAAERRGYYVLKEFIPGDTLDVSALRKPPYGGIPREEIASSIVDLVRDLRKAGYNVADLTDHNIVIDAHSRRAIWIDPENILRATADEWAFNAPSAHDFNGTTLVPLDGIPMTSVNHDVDLWRLATLEDHRRDFAGLDLGPLTQSDGKLNPLWITHYELNGKSGAVGRPRDRMPVPDFRVNYSVLDDSTLNRIRRLLSERLSPLSPRTGETLAAWREGLRGALSHPLFNDWGKAGAALEQIPVSQAIHLIENTWRTKALPVELLEHPAYKRLKSFHGIYAHDEVLANAIWGESRVAELKKRYDYEAAAIWMDAQYTSLADIEAAKDLLKEIDQLKSGRDAVEGLFKLEGSPWLKGVWAQTVKLRSQQDSAFAMEFKSAFREKLATWAGAPKVSPELRRGVAIALEDLGSLKLLNSATLGPLIDSGCCGGLIARYQDNLSDALESIPGWKQRLLKSDTPDGAAHYYLNRNNRWQATPPPPTPPSCVAKNVKAIPVP